MKITLERVEKKHEEWEKAEIFCPFCGKKDVWRRKEPHSSVFWTSEWYFCKCTSSFTLSLLKKDDERDQQRIKAIQNA